MKKKHLRCVGVCGEWGFSLGMTDFRQLAKSLLDSLSRTVAIFKDYVPGCCHYCLFFNKQVLVVNCVIINKRVR